jgi:hypothetical protein
VTASDKTVRNFIKGGLIEKLGTVYLAKQGAYQASLDGLGYTWVRGGKHAETAILAAIASQVADRRRVGYWHRLASRATQGTRWPSSVKAAASPKTTIL